MSFNRPTLSELIERGRADIESRLPGADTRLRHSLLDVLSRTHAGAASGLYGYVDFVARQIPFDTAEDEILARWASIWGVQRKAAVSSTGMLRFTGTNGSAIPAAVQLTRVDGGVYRTTAAGVIAGGEAIIAVESIDGGPGADMAEDGTLTLSSAVAGVNAVATVQAPGLTGGAAEENDADLLARFLQRVRQPPEGGSRSDYERWALELPEVTRAWVYPAWMGIGTVGITFVLDDREDIFPGSADLLEMEVHLDVRKPVTAELVVFAPVPRPVDMIIRLTPNTGPVQDAVLAELDDMFARDSEPGGTLRLSRIREAISLAQGETFHDLELPSTDPVSGPGEMLTLGEVTFL
jgi:uncharacterized phage protein gp47/JayE